MLDEPQNPKPRKGQLLRTKDGRYWDLAESTTSNNPLIAAPHGGGCICKIPSEDIADFDAVLPKEYRLVTVGFEDLAVCQAYVNFANRWNGWLQPLVDSENLPKFLQSQLRLASDCFEVCTGHLENDILHITHPAYEPDEANQLIPAQEIVFAERLIKVWPIGLGLTWEHVGRPYSDQLDPEQIAKEFSALLLEAIGRARFAELIRRNNRETNSNVCHSHDFVDANMVMHAAFLLHDVDATADIDNVDQNRVWNTAWDIAKKAQFHI